MENKPIRTEVDGITFLSTGHYYEGINQWVAHKLKEGDTDAFDYAARQMSKLLPKNAVLVPIPGRHGTPDQTLKLCRNIASYTHLPILDALRGKDRESQYEAKYKGRSLTEEQLGYRRIATMPTGRIPYLIDNVVDTGTTAKAAVKALGGGIVLSYAMSDTLLNHDQMVNQGFHR
jgi:predicted amidophosphoribosyltransferase